MADFVIVPRGPFSLELAAGVVACFPPLRHQPKPAEGLVRLGFIADRTQRPVAIVLRREAYGNVLHGTVAGTADVEAVRRQVARIFSLDHDGTSFPDLARRDPALAAVMAAFAGLRPVCFTSPYECACWAIISQRIAKEQAAKVVGELVCAHGEDVVLEGDALRVFPRPERLLELDVVPGLAAVKVARLRAIAEATLGGKLDADLLRSLPHAEALARLRELPGIGPFWASGILLRACGVADVFPDEPLSLAALGDRDADPATLTERYRPFGMWVAFLLRVAANRRSSARPPARRAASTTRRAPRAA